MDQFVTFYTHTGSDGVSDTVDQTAIVLRDHANGEMDIVIFPIGGPTHYGRYGVFDPDDPYRIPGRSYVRQFDSEPPDFEEPFRYVNDPEFAALQRKQFAERDAAPGTEREEIRERHQKEQAELYAQLDAKHHPAEDKPEPPAHTNETGVRRL